MNEYASVLRTESDVYSELGEHCLLLLGEGEIQTMSICVSEQP